MKVHTTRKDHRCSFSRCALGGLIRSGSIVASQAVQTGGGFLYLYFHPDCFVQSIITHIDIRTKEILEKRQDREERRKKVGGKRGRPFKYSDSNKVRNLKAKKWYYEHKVENVEVAERRQKEIDGLTLKEG